MTANPKASDTDTSHMLAALALAARGLGRVWPNPAVGAVLVAAGGHVVGRGWTQPGGRPHAETEALRRAGAAARGATAYVSLEPCSHQGVTPPCADALIGAGVARCVVAAGDPDPRVQGRGLERMREAGIEVATGLLEPEASELNAGFFNRVLTGRPLLTLKIASTLDGRIALADGQSRWITGEAARARVHLLRARHDAVLVGSGTAIKDDPELSCRLAGLGDRRPVRIVLDRTLSLPAAAKLVATASAHPTWLITGPGIAADRTAAYRAAGCELIEATVGGDGYLDLAAVMAELGRRGLTRVLVEGGSRLTAALLAADLVDRLLWFRSAGIIGGDGVPAAAALRLARLDAMPHFERTGTETLGEDVLESYKRRA